MCKLGTVEDYNITMTECGYVHVDVGASPTCSLRSSGVQMCAGMSDEHCMFMDGSCLLWYYNLRNVSLYLSSQVYVEIYERIL